MQISVGVVVGRKANGSGLKNEWETKSGAGCIAYSSEKFDYEGR